jgi:hypothetical protein
VFPPIRATDLVPFRLIADQLRDDPAYLDRKDCPYSPDVRDFLRNLAPLGAVKAAASIFLGEGTDKHEVIEAQIDAIYSELQNLTTQDPGERIQISKAKAALLEKLLTMSERTLGVKNISQFKKAVLKAVDVLSPADRTSFIDALAETEDA